MDIFGNAYNAGKSWPTTIVTSRQRYGCCGSGHILVEAYNVLKAIYEERGYRTRDIPKLILENNLFGLDIDDRAAQLAGFALLMKAREDDRRILTRNVRLNVLAMQSSQHLDANTLWRDLNLTGDWHQGQSQGLFDSEQQDLSSNDATYKLIADLIERFQDAKTFGSLIEVPNEWEAPLKALLEELTELSNSGDIMQKAAAQRLVSMVQQAWALAQRYDAVVANPPYMGSKGMNKALKDYAKKAYPNSKSDLFAIFMEHAFSLLVPLGYNAQINMQSWMFLSSYEKLREWLLDNTTIITMAHLGGRAFDSISGEVVSATAFVMEKIAKPDYKGAYLRLVEGKSEAEKKCALLEAIQNRDCGWLYDAKPDDFKKIPGSPVAYWASKGVISNFSEKSSLEDNVLFRQGMATSDNDRFLRFWYEVEFKKIGLNCKGPKNLAESKKKWFPYSKGGGYRKWYGFNDIVVNWENDGFELKEFTSTLTQGMNVRLKSRNYYCIPNVTYSALTSYKFSARLNGSGFLFGTGGSCVFGEDNLTTILCLLNSTSSDYFLSMISPTLNFEMIDVKRLPFEYHKEVEVIAKEAVKISKSDYDSFEVSYDFEKSPLIFNDFDRIKNSFAIYLSGSYSSVADLKNIEEKNNELFCEKYNISSFVSRAVDKKHLSLFKNIHYRYSDYSLNEKSKSYQSETIAELSSYSIGCMMGRYSLDKPGLILASQGESVRDYLAQIPEPSFAPDKNAIIPLTDQEWFLDDATNRFRDFVRTVWGAEHLQENLDFVAESLCLHAIKPKKGEAALETIRRYLSTQFFKDHLRTYKKRPIYWLFSSGKQKAFECLVYLHRYNESTLAEMRTDYVIPLTTKLASYVEKLEQDKDASTSAAEAKSIEKELSKLYKQQAELNTFDEKLRHYADQRISLDLDDGVKVNYGKFGDLLAEVKQVVGK
ncbi:BREX-1 system adenine-specific DNA-methyltransferase PglX [Vreelandella alkaliphila]|uniref:BREX-1 system adenine-specific DNA-methyltransferase PglX n=1 Tax=Vreelandella alkaliphila TaxID=272774 RepID=UPI003FD72541